MNSFSNIIEIINQFLWFFPMPAILMGTHIYFTIKLGFIQKYIPRGIRMSFSKDSTSNHGGISPYAALATSLAATIGTGNIIGISTAIAIGGPGAIFWCWITGVIGIATCYSECFLSVRYRKKLPDGTFTGGPMYILKYVLNKKSMAVLFALFTVFASFGIGSSVQSHSIYSALSGHLTVSPHIIGILLAILAGFVIMGGVSQISKVCTYLVPIMSLLYIGGCFYLLCLNHSYLCRSILLIFQSALAPDSIVGGFSGAVITSGFRIGISKGLFTNEAGLGSIPMTAAAANTKSPQKQGLISMTGVFWDTVVMCAITGIVIVSSILKTPSAYDGIHADRLCFIAFSQLPFGGESILALSLILFAFATIIGWNYYGECSMKFLINDCNLKHLKGKRGITLYQFTYLIFIYLGTTMSLNFVWNLSDLLNSFMVIPNLICLWLLKDKIQPYTK